ncbi:MAG: SH3 domain-containing protein [Spirochaetia bacterium]|nr:SH3 domain-containing protein [Spirochaetia bacterium]
MRNRYVTLVLFVVCGHISCQPKPPERLTVFVSEGLHIRARPDSASPSLALLPAGHTVSIVKQTDDPAVSVAGISGHWRRITFDGIEGWVFDGFLSSLPAPPKSGCNGLEQYAAHLGTIGNSRTFVSKWDKVNGHVEMPNLRTSEIWLRRDGTELAVRKEQQVAGGFVLANARFWEGHSSIIYAKGYILTDLFLLARYCLPSPHAKFRNAISFDRMKSIERLPDLDVRTICVGAQVPGGLSIILGIDKNLGPYAEQFHYYNCY